MFESIKNLKLQYSGKGISKKHFVVNKSECHIFIFRFTGSTLYKFNDGNELITNGGDLIFIPAGQSYTASAITNDDHHYLNIGFSAELNNPFTAIYSIENIPEAEYIKTHFYDLWNFGNHSEHYKCLSLFYSLVSYISNIENTKKSGKNKYHIIEPAIQFMHSHLFDCNLKIEQLHAMCGISNTYFRHIFELNFGTTPQKYIVNKRISHAKSIIDSGDYTSIAEVSTLVGYSDALYFSKSFKKKYGISPSDVNKTF